MIKNRFSYQANALGQTLAKRFAMVLTMLFLIGAVQVFGEEATLTFDNTSKRTIFTTNQQVWEENGIIFTNNKDKSSSNVADYSKPVRCYKNSEIIINCNSLGNIYQIVFKCTSSEYANHLKNSIGKEASVSETLVTLTPTNKNNTYSISLSSGQTRLSYLIVTYESKPTELYTVKLEDDGTEITQSTIGESLTLPTREGCSGYTFAGWTNTWTSPQEDWTSKKPNLIPSGKYIPSNNENLYPVYTKMEGDGISGYAITQNLSVGNTYIFGAVKANASKTLANNTTFGAVAFTNVYDDKNNNWGAKVDLTPDANGFIEESDNILAACRWELVSITNDNYAFKNSDNYIYLGTGEGSTTAGAQSGISTDVGNMYIENVNHICKDAFLLHPYSSSTNIMLYNTSYGYRMYKTREYSQSMTPYVRFYEYIARSITYYTSIPNCSTEPTVLTTPTNLQVADITATSATLSWTGDENASSYAVFITDGTNNIEKDVTTTSITISELSPNTDYIWDVKAIGDGINYADSEPSSQDEEGAEFTTLENIMTYYTITFVVNSQEYVKQENKYSHGDVLEFPEQPSADEYACNGYSFEGWTANEMTKEDTTEPTIISSSTIVTTDITYYAVWKKENEEGEKKDILYASFDDNVGTGGNDGLWSDNIALADIILYEGWSHVKGFGAKQCIKLGSGSDKGSVTTPPLSSLNGKATLTFKAAAWNNDNEQTELILSLNGGWQFE